MNRLILSLIVVALIATIGFGWLFDKVYQQYSTQAHSQPLDNVKTIEQLGHKLAKTLGQLPNRKAFVQRWNEGNDNAHQLALLARNQLVLPQNLLQQIEQDKPLLLQTNTRLVFHYYLSAFDEFLTLSAPLPAKTENQQTINYFFTVLFYLVLVLAILIWGYPLLRQLLSLRKVAQAYGEGDLNQRVEISRFSYIKDIQIEFNRMATRIAELVSDVKLLSSAVSHDLRTPLARIRFGIDTLQEEDDPELRRRYQKRISNNVDEMTDLVETLLSYARLDQTLLELKKDNVDLNELISQLVSKIPETAHQITFQKAEQQALIVGDTQYLTMLFNNLIQNALTYCQSKVLITTSVKSNQVTIKVSDDGHGIEPSIEKDLFKPFVRGKERQVNNKGHGVGLAIVKRIVDWHNAEIVVSKSPQLAGAEFVITFDKIDSR